MVLPVSTMTVKDLGGVPRLTVAKKYLQGEHAM